MPTHNSPHVQSNYEFLNKTDPILSHILDAELQRQQLQLEMIASENFTSQAVLAAQGSVLTNKYAEGYPGRRYYNGCEIVDQAEQLAIDRAKLLFSCHYANVQPHAGSQANQQVFYALLNPGDTFLGMRLDCGGHLTHGSQVNQSGKWFNAIGYGVEKDTDLIDMEEVRTLALRHRPKLIIAGGSAYPRHIDFAAFRKIADEIEAYFMVDMAHFAGLVAGKAFPNPLPHAHVVTTTTHKTLRGPRGGMILTNDGEIAKKINFAVFPGTQGGPLMHAIAGKAVAFYEALQPTFQDYARQIIANAQVLSSKLSQAGLKIVTGGTDCHLLLVDLRTYNINGAEAADTLEAAGITCNKNSVQNDPLPPVKTSGIRLGTPALTTRGMKENEMVVIADIIVQVLQGLRDKTVDNIIKLMRQQTQDLCHQFPLYKDF